LSGGPLSFAGFSIEDQLVSKNPRILVLSFYFEPDLCAGSFRTTALVKQLEAVMPAQTHIDVVTTLPNRYKTFSVEVPQDELRPAVSVHRMALPSHESGMLDQSRAFLGFAREALRHTKSRDYDLVFATSSRLMTAVLGAFIARRKRVPLYLDIRDIFADTIKDVLPGRLAWMVKPVFSALEKWAFSRAAHINLVSRGFADYFRSRYPGSSLSFFTNGIDDEFLDACPAHPAPDGTKSGLVTILYAGNIGEGQGLHNILPALAKRLEGRAQFIVIGDGGRKAALESALKESGSLNVTMLPPVRRDRLLEAYREADVLFLHLNDYDAFKKVLPSKLFEYAALGKPILAGVAGYAAEFVKTEISNAAVFSPCDENGAQDALATLSLQSVRRDAFIEKYARHNIMRDMARDILQAAHRKERAA
jgi:glycosyltransferase involved in cell wall biosynthesis